jgi:hypothetical protein
MVINGIIDLDNGELLEATGKHRISALDIQGSETAELKLTFYKNGSAVTDNSVVSGAVIDFGVKADADYTGTSYLIYHDTFSASTDGLTYSGTPTWATAEVETALGNESSVKLHGQVKVVISGVTYYSQVFEVEIHNNVIQAAGTTNSVIYPRLIQSTSDPTVNDDSLDGYGVSSLWLNTSSNAVHVLMDNTAGAAVWAGFLGLTNGQLANNLVFNDDLKAVFGTSSDGLEIYHSSNNSYIDDSGTGNLHIRSNGSGVFLQKSNGDNLAKFNTDGAAELYYSGNKKIESTNLGATVTGKLIVSGDLDVDGTTTTFNSTVVTVDDPVFGIGGDTAPGSQDNKDRGVSFRYHDGTSAKVGFYGWDNSENAFTFLTDTNDDSTEVFNGTLADVNVANVQLENSGKIKFWSNDTNYIKFNEWKTQASTQKIENITGDIELKASDSSGTIQFETNGTEAARFDSDGNFTTVENIKIPDGKFLFLGGSTDLQVYHNGFHSAIDNYTSDLYIRNRVNGGKDIIFLTKNSSDVLTELLRLDGSASSINVPDNIIFKVGTGALSVFHNDNNETWNYFSSSSGPAIFSHAANDQDFVFQTTTGGTTSEVLRLDGSTGNVGIGGVTSPSAKLEISGTDSSTTDTFGLKISNENITTNSNGGILFKNYDNHGAWIRSIRTGSANGKLSFGTNSGAGIAESNISERMVIDHNGNVGIGTTNPLSSLHIGTNDATNGDLMIGTNNDPMGFACEFVSNNNTKLHIGRKHSADSEFIERVTILDEGNVGIGTTSPATKLVIDNGGIGTVDSGYSLAILGDGIDGVQIISSSSNQGRIVFGDNSSNAIGRLNYDHSNDSMSFVTNGSEAMRIDSSGNVGIGTTAPDFALD